MRITSLCTAALALLLGALCPPPAEAQMRVVAADAERPTWSPPALPYLSPEAVPALVYRDATLRVRVARAAHAEAAHAETGLYRGHLRATLLAPAALAADRDVRIEDAVSLLRRTEPRPPVWLDELDPLFEARAAVADATEFTGEGYTFGIDPLKLRGRLQLRLGGSLGTLLPLFLDRDAERAAERAAEAQ